MGDSSFELSRLHDDAEQEGVVSPILKDGKERGELRYDLSWYPIMQPEEGSEELADSCTSLITGLAGLLAHLTFLCSCGYREAYHPSSQGTRHLQVHG